MDIYGFKNFKRIHPAATIISGLIVAVLVCLASFILANAYEAASTHGKSLYKHVGNGTYAANENTYYLLNNINVKADKNSPIQYPHVFMQVEGGNYYGNYLDGMVADGAIYNQHECAISADFADKMGIKAGGRLSIHIIGADGDYTVTVKKILPEYYGYDKTDVFNPKGAVVLGFNSDAVESQQSYKVYSFVEQDNAIFSGGTEAPIHKSDILEEIYKYYYVAIAPLAAAIVIAALLLELSGMSGIFLGSDERIDASAFYAITGNKSKKLLYIAVYSFYKYLMTFALSSVLSLFALFFGYKVAIAALINNVILLIVSTALSILINHFISNADLRGKYGR